MKKIIILFSIFILSSLTSFAQSQYEQMQVIMMIINSSELYLKNLQSQNNESDYMQKKHTKQDIATLPLSSKKLIPNTLQRKIKI